MIISGTRKQPFIRSRAWAIQPFLWIACLWIALPTPQQAMGQDNKAKAVFDEVYAEPLKQVAATGDPTDDVALAKQMLEVAQGSTKQINLLTLLCQTAAKLGARHSSGYPTAISAWHLLGSHVPTQLDTALTSAIALRTRQFGATRNRDAKAEVGDVLIDEMDVAAEIKQTTGDWDGAVLLYRKALLIARQIRSDRVPLLQATLKEVVTQQRAHAQIKLLKDRFKADPKDAATAKALLEHYLIENDDPKAAAPYAAASGEADAAKKILKASEPLAKLTPAEAKVLGSWYHKLSHRAKSDTSKARMLTRARDYYQHILAANPADTLASLLVKNIKINLSKLGGPMGGVPGGANKTAPNKGPAGTPNRKPPTPIVLAGSGSGMFGRTTVNRQDVGLGFRYTPGTMFMHDKLQLELSKLGHAIKRVNITLYGVLKVPRDMEICIWHMGGTPSGGVTYLHIDGDMVNSVGDDRKKNVAVRIFIKKGIHELKWVITGGHVGRNLLQIYDPSSKRPLPISSSRQKSGGGPLKATVNNSSQEKLPSPHKDLFKKP